VQLPANFGHILGVFFRIIGCVSGIYTAAYLHRPIPRNVAILSTLAGYIAVHLAMVITKIVYERCYPIPVYELIHVSEETINGDE
jgi:hypothetical protein